MEALQTNPSGGIPLAAFGKAEDTRVKAAFVLYLTEDGYALFTRRSENANHPGEWDFPGGGVDEGESDEEAAQRESMEEIGVSPGELGEPIDAQADEDGVDATTFLHRTKRFVPQLNPNEHDKYVWAKLSDPPEPLHDGVARTLHAQSALGRLPALDGWLPRREGAHLPSPKTKHRLEPLPKPGPHASTGHDAAPVEVDREHDGPWMSVISKDGGRVYVNKNLPHYADIKGKTANVDEMLVAHEVPELAEMRKRIDVIESGTRHPVTDESLMEIYEDAHEKAGIPGEKAACETAGIDWDGWNAWCRGEETKLEKGPFENEPADAHVRPVPHRHGELMAATDSALQIALDRATVRDVDLDGRMHVGISNISKGNVSPYRGREIPDYEELGLEPDEIYQLYRHPAELEKAAPTFNRVQLLKRHIPVSADDHKPYDVIGTTGSDCVYEHPYLRNSLTVWAQDAIDDVLSGDKRELSCGYHYVADMTPGISIDGDRYDGVMRNIIGNHVAIVEEGRAGSDVVVGDSAENVIHATIAAAESLATSSEARKMTKLPTKFANLACQLTSRSLRPVMAKDSKFPDLMPVFADITSKNFPERKKTILASIEKLTKGRLAKDANLGHLTELLDHLEHPSSDESVSGEQHKAMAAAAGGHSNLGIPKNVGEEFLDADRGKHFDNALPDFLRGKGLDEEAVKEACDMAFGSKGKDETPEAFKKDKEEAKREETPAKDEETEEEKKKREEEEKAAKDNLPAHEGTAAAMTGDKKPAFDQKAFDAALDAAKKQIRSEVRENEREIRMALDEVKPYVGELRGGEYETPKQVYRATLKMLGVDEADLNDMNKPAMRAVLKNMPKAGARPPVGSEDRIAMDSGSIERLAKKFPGIERIKIG
jgi:8-oxo-dGTP pyrophosphatase MutT (NUDIX family)